MSESLFIFGAGGLAKEVTQLVEDINAVSPEKYDIKGYVVIKPVEPLFRGKALSSEEQFHKFLETHERINVVIAIGTPSVRRRCLDSLINYDIQYPRLIHPSAQLNSSVLLGEGVTICANVICTVDISIGRHTYVNFGCTIAHDVRIGEFVQINPMCGISGRVRIGDSCLIGAGSTVYESVEIGADSTVGMGSVVLRNVKPGTTVFGNPARQLPSPEYTQTDLQRKPTKQGQEHG